MAFDILDGDTYKGNKIVRFLLEMCDSVDINRLWRLTDKGLFTKEELIEFYKMIGYSREGMNELFEK
jgi:argininosuccinate synthase